MVVEQSTGEYLSPQSRNCNSYNSWIVDAGKWCPLSSLSLSLKVLSHLQATQALWKEAFTLNPRWIIEAHSQSQGTLKSFIGCFCVGLGKSNFQFNCRIQMVRQGLPRFLSSRRSLDPFLVYR